MIGRIFILTFIALTPLFTVKAGLFVQYSGSYISDSGADEGEKFEYSGMRNMLLIGATFGRSGNVVIGQNVLFLNRTGKATSLEEEKLSTLELGPRVQWFLNDAKTFYISGAYHFYARGSRKMSGEATEQDVSGKAYFANVGIQLRLSRMAYLGLSFNYHNVTLDESSVGSTRTEISHTYTSIYPALDFSLRFR